MSDGPVEWLDIRGGRIGVHPGTGALVSARLGEDGRQLVERPSGAGLLRVALPVEGYGSHYLEAGVHGAPRVERLPDGLRLVHTELSSEHVTAAVRVEIELRSADEGLVVRARVHNGSDLPIPQVAFPQLLGLGAVPGSDDARVGLRASAAGHPPRISLTGSDETRLRLSRGTVWPLRQLSMRPDDASFLETPLQRYFGYGAFEFSMKWFDYGDSRGGLTMYSRDPRYAAQGLLVERPDRTRDEVDLRWLHFPTIGPGESWESGDFVLLLHQGDWYAGARAFQEFAAQAYPYNAPQHIREALGIRTVWPAIRHAPPNFTIDVLPEYAEEVADVELGLAELCVWHWWEKNGLPVILNPRLGTEDDLRAALARCTELGVPVSMFVSHHLLRDTDETPDEWRHLNAAGQPVQDDWTYGRDFLPRFHIPFMGTHAMMRGSLLSPGLREAILAEHERILDLGATSTCWDQFWSWFEPSYNPSADGAPDEEGDRLLDVGRAIHDLVRSRNPRGTFSGEMMTEQKVPMLDYTWEWRNSADLDEDAPFRYVFPQVRLNANVNEHPRGALLAFADGGLINVMPGQMNSYRLADCPDLDRTLRQLSALRRRFLGYFCEGQYRHVEGLTAVGCHARAYSWGERVLVVVLNATDDAVEASMAVDPRVWGGRPVTGSPTVVDLDGATREGWNDGRFSGVVEPDGLRLLEFV
ncbi:hypothetical protein LL946_17670 [Knoellia locipacati]|uniref:hypothetical protein n=1 Tax=Knoellia locipacati TaxID=882824 RepID=UPI0038503F9B